MRSPRKFPVGVRGIIVSPRPVISPGFGPGVRAGSNNACKSSLIMCNEHRPLALPNSPFRTRSRSRSAHRGGRIRNDYSKLVLESSTRVHLFPYLSGVLQYWSTKENIRDAFQISLACNCIFVVFELLGNLFT